MRDVPPRERERVESAVKSQFPPSSVRSLRQVDRLEDPPFAHKERGDEKEKAANLQENLSPFHRQV